MPQSLNNTLRLTTEVITAAGYGSKKALGLIEKRRDKARI